MITLPPSLKVDRDSDAERALLARARAWIDSGERAKGIHASDLLMPRKGFFRTLDPQASSDREVGLFLAGKILHAFVLSEEGGGKVNLLVSDEGSKYDEDLGLWYSPDYSKNGRLAEFKSSRALHEAKDAKDLEIYLQQLLIYMAAEKLRQGEIWVLYLSAKDDTGKTSPTFRVYRVAISDDELEAVRLEVRNLRDQLATAIQRSDHLGLPLCPAWVCHPNACAWWAKCKPEGRYENSEYVKGKRK